MPLYRKECAECGCEFRILELQGEESGSACPSCGASDTRRLLPRVAVQFKGSGFYKTDHARSRRRGNASSGAKSAEATATAESPAE